ELVGQQEDDQVIRVVRDRVRQEGPLARTELKEEEYRPYRRVWLTLFVHSSGLLVRKLRPEVLERFHALAGHFRREHMVAALKRTAYWPGMSKANVALPHLPFVPYPVGTPWHTVAIDFLMVAPSRGGGSKLLVVVDHFTRWAEAVPVAGE
ncbi:hypothetical protein FOZ61_005255, partial [Perkinsus olseni]